MLDYDNYYSRACFRQALLSLMGEKSFDIITVKDIVYRSNHSRSTFYLHYRDKYQLLEEIESELISGFEAQIRRVQTCRLVVFLNNIIQGFHPDFLLYFHYIKKNAEAFIPLVKNQHHLDFSHKFITGINKYRLEHASEWFGGEINPIHMQTFEKHFNGDFPNIFIDWVKNGLKPPEEEMAAMLSFRYKGYILMFDDMEPNEMLERILKLIQKSWAMEKIFDVPEPTGIPGS